MTLEEKIAEGVVTYFDGVIFDSARGRLEFKFLKNPEVPMRRRTVTFFNIQDFSKHWHDEEDDSMANLIGIDEHPEGNGTRYSVCSNLWEISFYSELEPQIE
jgi:hypothetical protein